MSMQQSTRTRWLVLATVSLFAAITPQASAQTPAPVWTCRASAAYVETGLLLSTTRVEPVLANGFPNATNPDSSQCASADTGVQNIPVFGENPLVDASAAFASTSIDPTIPVPSIQTVAASGGVADVTITLGSLVITAQAVKADATASCVDGVPSLTGSSTFVNLLIGGQTIELPSNGSPVDLNLTPIIRVRINRQIVDGNAGSADQALTQRALDIEVLPTINALQPLARVIVGEAKVDRHGAVCTPPGPGPACPAGFISQDPSANPQVCVKTVTAPCPTGSTANGQGACIVTPTPAVCPAGTVREPTSNTCILVVQRPCPPGTTADPATRICILRVNGGTTVASSGQNGGIGSADGARPTCGVLSMRFVRGFRNLGTKYTSRFGTRTVTRGRLVTCGSNPRPIVGARIDVVHVLPGNKRRRKTGLRSRANGLLTLILPIDLKSRKIEYAYRPNLNTTRVTSRRTLTLTVKNKTGKILR
jgi:hypothetical protein